MKSNGKISKYEYKLSNTTDVTKKSIYRNKLDYYRKILCKNIDEAGLQKPRPLTSQEYKLDFDDPVAIKAIGYGNINEKGKKKLIPMEFERRAPRNDDIVIEILYCGVCHSDWHVYLNEWQNTKYPMICGHEIVGRVAKIGASVKKFKVGDMAALGPNYNSCGQCPQCEQDNEQYCAFHVTETYNMPDRKPGEKERTGPITYGGYSNVIVVNERYAINVPSDAPADKVAPLLCAGATMYTPLKTLGIGAGHRVGIVGIGGLGHIGIKLAKAFGAEVFALTHTLAKVQKLSSLGANQTIFIGDMDELRKYEGTFDLIIDTVPFNHDLMPYVMLTKPNSTLWIVGSMFTMAADFNLINRGGRIVRGSSTAGIAGTQECVDFCITNNIYPDIELINIKNINETHRKLLLSEVKYRYVIDMKTIYEK